MWHPVYMPRFPFPITMKLYTNTLRHHKKQPLRNSLLFTVKTAWELHDQFHWLIKTVFLYDIFRWFQVRWLCMCMCRLQFMIVPTPHLKSTFYFISPWVYTMNYTGGQVLHTTPSAYLGSAKCNIFKFLFHKSNWIILILLEC